MTQKQVIVTVTINKVPHPNPQRAMDLVAKLVFKNFSEEFEQTRNSNSLSATTETL